MTTLIITLMTLFRVFGPYPYQEEIRHAGLKYDIDTLLIASVIDVESKFNSKAIGSGNCVGLMQVKNGSSDPQKNIIQGTSILSKYYRITGDLKMTIGSYNMGYSGYSKYYKKYKVHSPYVRKVLSKYCYYVKNELLIVKNDSKTSKRD